jgi:glucokinase
MRKPIPHFSHPPLILAGDIGGTKTRLGIFAVSGGNLQLIDEMTFPSPAYRGLKSILSEFLEGKGRVASACFGVAGPVIQGRVRTTNLPWVITRESLQKELRLDRVEIINDLVANAFGITMLKRRNFEILNKGSTGQGNKALISAGTGLGVAVLFWDGKKHIPSPSEGGHVEFGPRSRLEMELLDSLFGQMDHVSYERILSGAGILNIYRFLRESGKYGSESEWLALKMTLEDPASVISEMARLKKSRLCVKAIDMFASVYGAAAGNLALSTLAVGGIYVGGGIAPRIIWKLKDGTFMRAFKDKGRYAELMARIPVKVILNDRAALLGAAHHAMELLPGC